MALAPRPVALVTGAASGLGRAVATALGRRGGRVLVTDLPGTAMEATCVAVRAAGGEAAFQPLDVTDPAEFEAAWLAAEEAFGPVDLVVNNAGIAVVGPMAQVSVQDWRAQMDVNLFGVVHGCRLAAQRMRGRGAILNVASGAGLLSPPKMAPYNVSKAAVVALTETLAAELGPGGTTCTVLAPLFFQTNLIETSRVTDERLKRKASQLMAEGKLSADQVAEAALKAVERGDLYALPMRDGRWYWRLKRLAPQGYVRVLDFVARRKLKG